MGNYSLTKAKKGCGLFLIHEHQGEDLFKEMPFLNEFRKEKVFKGVKDKSLRAPKTVKVPSKCVDSQGNQMGCKSPYSLLTTFSVSALRHSWPASQAALPDQLLRVKIRTWHLRGRKLRISLKNIRSELGKRYLLIGQARYDRSKKSRTRDLRNRRSRCDWWTWLRTI